jgi:uncharacterized protein YdeI (BOF family)
MRRFTIILALLAVAAVSPAAAFGKAKGTDRPVSGKTTSTTTVDIAPPGSGTSVGVGQISHLGRTTFTNDFTSVTITGETVSFTLTGIIVAANGDEIFTTGIGTGTLTATGSEATLVSTITGGTGRFTDASGTITTTISSENVSLVGTTLTSSDTETHTGRVSY